MHRRTSATRRVLARLTMVATAALVLAACSPGADYPSIFPAIHDMPPPRADAPLDALQVQQATEDLITQRNHLTAEAQGAAKASASEPADATGAAAAKKQAQAKPAPAASKPAGVPGHGAPDPSTVGALTNQ